MKKLICLSIFMFALTSSLFGQSPRHSNHPRIQNPPFNSYPNTFTGYGFRPGFSYDYNSGWFHYGYFNYRNGYVPMNYPYSIYRPYFNEYNFYP